MKPKMEPNTRSLVVIGVGIGIGKEVFHLVRLGIDGKIAFRRKIRRLSLKDAFEKLPPCIVGMEACLSAHFVSRVLRALGHEPQIIPAIYVKPFVTGQKNGLQRCRGDRRGSVTTESALCPGEEPRPARPAGVSSRPVPTGLPSDRDNQPDPSFPDRAGYCRQVRSARPSQLALRDIGEPKGRDLASNV